MKCRFRKRFWKNEGHWKGRGDILWRWEVTNIVLNGFNKFWYEGSWTSLPSTQLSTSSAGVEMWDGKCRYQDYLRWKLTTPTNKIPKPFESIDGLRSELIHCSYDISNFEMMCRVCSSHQPRKLCTVRAKFEVSTHISWDTPIRRCHYIPISVTPYFLIFQ